jgi:hypothetical protein
MNPSDAAVTRSAVKSARMSDESVDQKLSNQVSDVLGTVGVAPGRKLPAEIRKRIAIRRDAVSD